ncbi:MAG: deoxycytidylate deaminase [Holophagaceae bacterium]
MKVLSHKWHWRYMELAKNVALWSKDPSSQIGSVAVGAKGQILSQGYNGFPRGIEDTDERLRNRPTKYQYVVHAEMNVIYNATYNGISLDRSVLYVWGLPICSDCAKGIIQVGIREVYWCCEKDIPDNWNESMALTASMFKEVGIKFERLSHESSNG